MALFIFGANVSNATGFLGLLIVKTILTSFLGIGVLVLPIFIGAYGVILLMRHEVKELRVRLTGLLILFLSYITVAQFVGPKYFKGINQDYLQGAGGMLGFGLKFAMVRTVGVWGAYLIITALILIGILTVLNVTFINILDFIKAIFRPGEARDKGKEKVKVAEAQAKVEQLTPPIPEQKPVIEFPLPKFDSDIEIANKFKTVSSDAPQKRYSKYKLPPIDLLEDATAKERQQSERLRETTELRKKLLEEALRSFGVGARVVSIFQGPAVTRFELQPDPGVKVSRIANLSDDIALNLAAQGVRIEAPVPGKSVVGIEVPNATITPVRLKEIVKTREFTDNSSKLFVAIGKDLAGLPIFGDISRMPHLLIAGTTGSGKSVCINSVITSILLRARPDEVRMLMIDPKMVELSVFDGIPHLLAPVVTDARRAAATLKEWVVHEMERRYKIFHDSGTRNLQAYNRKIGEEGQLPEIAVIVDELADLMMIAANDVESSICRIAQLARATGIHLIIATQRPSVDVITGLIKANIPSRIAFAVATQIDSRVVLDMSGAEKLLGRGDMLYNPIGAMKPIRVQGSFVTDKETERIIKFVKEQAQPEYLEAIMALKGTEIGKGKGVGDREQGDTDAQGHDTLFADVARLIIDSQQTSTSYIQRKFRIGYNRAARLMDEMQEAGIVSPPEGELKTRRVTATREKLESFGPSRI
ncbi:MAG: DNA translocase FtsK 4TM domain-containing protein [Candidatus Margulisbacteria bacterium]|nr:DNA translocase FtsK 4TM domain-containing protein [Candidatus Margulisiibacteriota bacterium]